MSEVVKLQGYGAPNEDTPGAIGQIYKDLNTGKEYECIEIHTYSRYKYHKTVYTWEEQEIDPAEYLKSHTHEQTDIVGLDKTLDSMATDKEVDMAIEVLKEEFSGGISGGSGISIYAEIVD